jgi:hypothetical protein
MKRAVLLLLLVAGCSNNSTSDDGGFTCQTLDAGVCIYPPTAAAQRTQCGDVTEFCDTTGVTTPNLSCLTTPKQGPATPASVTVTGFIHVFSSGPNSSGVSVAFFDASPLLSGTDINQVAPLAMLANVQLDPTTQRACDLDPHFGCSLPAADCGPVVCADGLNGHPDQQKYCRQDPTGTTCADRLRWEARYTVNNIPTNKQLVVRATGPNGAADQTWANLVTWNVFLSTGDHACKSNQDNDCINTGTSTYQLNVNTLSKSDYVNIPVTAGLSGGIPAGEGAAAGEVHDCDNIRIENAAVATAPAADRSSYFNGNPIMTLPDSSRQATDRLGLFTSLGIKPGKVHVVAAGLLDPAGPLTELGTFDAFIYADTVSVINVNGGKPLP